MWFMDSVKNFWKKTKEFFNNTVDYTAEKIWNKSLVKKISEIDELIENSKTTEFYKEETWETKHYKHKNILILVDEKTEDFKSISIIYPILKTKAFSQNIKILMSHYMLENSNLKERFWVEQIPAMIVFQDKEIYKTIFWKENIEKIWKSVKINIEETIDKF